MGGIAIHMVYVNVHCELYALTSPARVVTIFQGGLYPKATFHRYKAYLKRISDIKNAHLNIFLLRVNTKAAHHKISLSAGVTMTFIA